MAVDRPSTADGEVETIEEPSAAERQPPPDRPGQADAPSRADSRVGAAAANSDVREQAGGASEVEEKPEAAPSTDDSTGGQPSEAAEDASAKGETTSESREQNDETAAQRLSPLDGASEAAGTAPDAPAEVPDTGETEEAAGQPARTDAASQEDALSSEGNSRAEDGELSDVGGPDVEDDAEGTPGQADEVMPRQAEVDDAGADDTGAGPEQPIRAKDAPAIAGPAKDVRDLPKAAEPRERSTVDKEVTSRRLEPLTDHEYAEHTARIEPAVSDSLARGEATDVQHTLNPERTIWHPDRAEIHQQIVDDLYSAAADVPNDGHAIVAGGLGGAGKSTTLEEHAGIDRSSYLTINPDDIKESLAKRGLVPPVEGLAPMERSALVHEESSAIARSLAGRAYADRKNVIWDITMSSKVSTAKRVQQLREAGYADVEGIFVHIPVATSVERAQARHRRGLEDYRNGEGFGGRYVPPDVIRANADATWGSVNRGVFEELKPQFDTWRLYDNSVDGRGPVLLQSSDGSERNDDE